MMISPPRIAVIGGGHAAGLGTSPGWIYRPMDVPKQSIARAEDPQPLARPLGLHLIVELQGCDPEGLNDVDFLRQGLRNAATAGGLHVVALDMHAFAPHGVTGVALLSESHISIHTWPELRYAAVDIFSCGGNPHGAMIALREHLGATGHTVREIVRGLPATAPR